jgi:hypothetical protein
MEPFDSQRIGLEALNGFLENVAGDPGPPARRLGGIYSDAPIQ